MQPIMSSIAANLQGVNALIAVAADAANRGALPADISDQSRIGENVGRVTLVAVSKTKPASAVLEAFAAGQRHFGENYVQEAVEKITSLRANQTEGIVWHLIGPLQSNKARLVASHFDWVQSVDREKIAAALNTHRPLDMPALNVLIQVNVSGEAQKGGVAPEDVPGLANVILQMDRLCLRGVMSILENTPDETALRAQFRAMRDCFDALRRMPNPFAAPKSPDTQGKKRNEIDTLSIGMSQDYQIAIEEGSNMVRIGRAIFGDRQ
jgi:PLP dependent protein